MEFRKSEQTVWMLNINAVFLCRFTDKFTVLWKYNINLIVFKAVYKQRVHKTWRCDVKITIRSAFRCI